LKINFRVTKQGWDSRLRSRIGIEIDDRIEIKIDIEKRIEIEDGKQNQDYGKAIRTPSGNAD
jgi:hypothetical protein